MLVSHYLKHTKAFEGKIFLVEETDANAKARDALATNEKAVRELIGNLPFDQLFIEFQRRGEGTSVHIARTLDGHYAVNAAFFIDGSEKNPVLFGPSLYKPETYKYIGDGLRSFKVGYFGCARQIMENGECFNEAVSFLDSDEELKSKI